MRAFFNAPPVMTAFQQLATTIRRGGSDTPVAARSALWTTFASSTLPLRRRWAADVARELHRQHLDRGRILEWARRLAAGIESLRRSRSASLVVQDRASVVKVALQHAMSVGVGNRVTALRGDATTRPWGGPFELVLMVNLLDYFDLPTRRHLLRKARAALAPGGVLVVCAPLLEDGSAFSSRGRRLQPDAARPRRARPGIDVSREQPPVARCRVHHRHPVQRPAGSARDPETRRHVSGAGARPSSGAARVAANGGSFRNQAWRRAPDAGSPPRCPRREERCGDRHR